jgi:hypothetical protein
MAISVLGKPAGAWCPDCAIGQGCRIYANRPAECRTFACGWLVDPKLGEEWRPSRSRIMLVAGQSHGHRRLAAHVDPARPDAWRREPFYGQLKEWARVAAEMRGQVVVYVGRRATVLLPDRDVPVGVMGDDDVIAVSVRMTGGAPHYEARRVPLSELTAVSR